MTSGQAGGVTYQMLPSGGVYVSTAVGSVQIGAPPETLKDSLSLGLEVPTTFVLPGPLFDRERGINVAEVEFPAYYNFFVLGRKTRLVVEGPEVESRIRRVFQETLFGPGSKSAPEEFADHFPRERRPNFQAESDYFRTLPGGERLVVDHLLEFAHLGESDRLDLGASLEIVRSKGRYVLRGDGADLLTTPGRTVLPDSQPEEAIESDVFVPPDFGVTILGSSHGFDPKGKTTGFILWLGRRGLLVDPPADTSAYLKRHNVPAKLVEGIVITHCHADHDGGAFQKILEEGRLDVYTTPTILGSFLRKYSALSGISEDVLRRTFRFRPVTIGAPSMFNGGELRFFYTLHSIPTIGFEAFYGGKSLAFSSDSLYDVDVIRELEERKVITGSRAQALIDFPWHRTVVLHEAGVPPLHTPAANLAALPEQIRKSLYVVHIAEKDVPEGLRPGPVGLANTIRIEVDKPEHADATAILDVFCSVDLFRDLPVTLAREVLQLTERVHYSAGEQICAEGEPGDAFFIIEHGTVTVKQKGYDLKSYHTGDYFGETSLVLGQPRNASVIATSDVSLLRIRREAFLYLLRGTQIPERMVQLASVRSQDSWQVFERNAVLGAATGAQKTSLQTLLRLREVDEGERLWSEGEPVSHAFLLDSCSVRLQAPDGMAEPFAHGAFIGDIDAMYDGESHSTSAVAVEPGRVFAIERDDLLAFFERNPGLMLAFLGTRFVE